MAGKNYERKPETAEKQRQVVELRAQGLPWHRIAELTGYSAAAGAYLAYQRALNYILAESVDELRQIENERLNTAQAAIWPKVIDGDPAAVTSLLKIMERRAKLYGLDMPAKTQIEVTYHDSDSIDAEVARLAALLDSSPPNTLAAGTSETGTVTT